MGTTLENVVKIGFSKNPWARIVDIQTESFEKLSVLAAFRSNDPSEVAIHHILAEFRQHREWFLLPKYIQDSVLAAASNKENYGQLVARLRSQLRSRATTENYATTAETETETEQSRSARGKSRSTSHTKVCDEDYLEELQANPAYQGLNVPELFHKMCAWCQVRGKKPTRTRLVSWLNREERPMALATNGHHPKAKYCGKCNSGWLRPDPDKGETRARRCDCATRAH